MTAEQTVPKKKMRSRAHLDNRHHRHRHSPNWDPRHPDPTTLIATAGVSRFLATQRLDLDTIRSRLVEVFRHGSPAGTRTPQGGTWFDTPGCQVLIQCEQGVILKVTVSDINLALADATVEGPGDHPDTDSPAARLSASPQLIDQDALAQLRKRINHCLNAHDISPELAGLTFTPGVAAYLSSHNVSEHYLTELLAEMSLPSTLRIDNANNHHTTFIIRASNRTAIVDEQAQLILHILKHPQSQRTEPLAPAPATSVSPQVTRSSRQTTRDTGAGRGAQLLRLPTPQNTAQLIERLRDKGFVLHLHSGGHYKLSHPTRPGVSSFMGATPSDHRAIKNSVSQVRRTFGIDLRLP